MFAKRFAGIITVYNDEVLWLAGRQPEPGRCVLRLPLEQVLTDETVAGKIPKELKGNYKTLCIVPDHWFGMERYPFQSTRPAIIEPFLERKLAAAFPERKAMRHFFNYRQLGDGQGDKGLLAYFLQDEIGYRLYDALKKMEAAPRHITTTAFLWAERLAQISADFQQEGTLLIHTGDRECMLYFYFKGSFMFSRDVVLSDGPDRLEALSFEINQSLYMFSQKAKSELQRVYLLACALDSCAIFGEALGREVIDMQPILKESAGIAIDAAPFLDGLLLPKDLSHRVPFFSLIHRQAKQELEWEPVQWAGILVGALLLVPLLGEGLMLSNLLDREVLIQRNLRQQVVKAGAGITQYDQALNTVLAVAEQPACAETVRRILSSLPADVQVQELSVDLEDQPVATLKAALRAENAEQLKAALGQLVMRLRVNLKTAQEISMNNIEINLDPSEEAAASQQYIFVLRLELL